jgi:hypothetical protein
MYTGIYTTHPSARHAMSRLEGRPSTVLDPAAQPGRRWDAISRILAIMNSFPERNTHQTLDKQFAKAIEGPTYPSASRACKVSAKNTGCPCVQPYQHVTMRSLRQHTAAPGARAQPNVSISRTRCVRVAAASDVPEGARYNA